MLVKGNKAKLMRKLTSEVHKSVGFEIGELSVNNIAQNVPLHFDLYIITNNISKHGDYWREGIQNQISYISLLQVEDRFKNQSVSQITRILKQQEGSTVNTYGHLIIFFSITNYDELVLIISKIGEAYKSKSMWSPYYFIEYPDTLVDFNLELTLSSVKQNANDLIAQLPINSDVYLIQRSSKNISQSQMMEIYSIKNNTFFQNYNFPMEFLEQNSQPQFYNVLKKSGRRSNFHKATIAAVSMDTHGYELATDFDDDNSTKTQFSGGFEVLQYWYLRDALNFTERAIKGSGYVREGPGGTLTGMAVTINTEEADICISSTEFLEYRISGKDGFSYLQPTFHIEMLAFFKQPPASSIRDVFTSAFSFNLWLLLLGLWIFICLSMYSAYRIYKYKNIQNDDCWKDIRMTDEITIWAAGAICQQGWYFSPQTMTPRIIFFFGWFTGFMCYIAFSAQLVSILSIEVVPIRSFSDLLREKFFIYNDGHIPTTKYYVKGLQERGVIPELAENIRNVDIEETIDKLIKSSSTMITVSDSFYPILQKAGYSEQLICSTLSEVKLETTPVKMSMFVKRGSSFRETFNHWILIMTERGVKNRLMRVYLIDTSVQCLRDTSGFNSPLGSKDIFTAYAILISGFILSVSLTFLEKLYHRIKGSSPPPPPPPPFTTPSNSHLHLFFASKNLTVTNKKECQIISFS